MEIIYLIVTLLAVLLCFFYIKRNNSREAEHIALLNQDNLRLLAEKKDSETKISALQTQLVQAISARDVHAANISNLQKQLDSAQKIYEEQIAELKSQHAKQLDDLKKIQAEQMSLQMNLLKEQINTASEKILTERSEQLSVKNSEQLSAILNPLKVGINQMKEAVEKNNREHAETMVRLDETIKTSIAQSKEVGERADKLAQALTGENKTQGNFGELRLKQLLEDMGFEEGVQFEEQATMKDSSGRTIYEEEGHRMIPDVILHFPDKRDVIIDSKISLKAFEDYHNATNDEERQNALQRHLTSLRNHVTELSRKNYSSYIKDGRGKLNFVMMYVFSESALQLGLSNDTTLWKDAYDKGVLIIGSQSLYMMLRVLELTWRQVKQVENQESMMKVANMIVDRVQMFYERIVKLEEMFDKTKKSFEEVKSITSPSGQSIETAARHLIQFGAQENPKRKYKLKGKEESAEPLLESITTNETEQEKQE